MRRAGPILILVVFVIATILSFVAVPLPGSGGETRTLETKLGLDLRGGLRLEYQVLPAEGKAPTRESATTHIQTGRELANPAGTGLIATGLVHICRYGSCPASFWGLYSPR